MPPPAGRRWRSLPSGTTYEERAPDWDDERFPAALGTLRPSALATPAARLERMHRRPVDPARLEPATRAWIIDNPPVSAADHLEAAEHLWAFARRVLASWPADTVLVTPS